MILILAEHNNKTLHNATLSAISAAKKLGEVTVLVAGFNCETVAKLAANYADRVIYADNAVYEAFLAETICELLEDIAKSEKFTHVLAPATSSGKNVLPRLAAKLNVTQLSDVIEVIDAHTYKRPIYAGNAIATVKNRDALQIVTIRSTAFPLAAENTQAAQIEKSNFVSTNNSAKFINNEQHNLDKPQLDQAEIVISGGRGLKDAAGFSRLAKIAERMGAAFGASRAAVDAGLAPNDCQVGQTGKVVAPKIYFAVGISGAIQHLAGMKDSKIIVAINKDPDAPIFQIADYAIVGDIENVLPEWEAALDKMKR